MIFKRLRSGLEVADHDFDSIYSDRMRIVSEFHFTPVEVAKTAAQFLAARPGTKVLDVGSGAGKFCMIGAACTEGHFTGVEQRESLWRLSEELTKRYALPNTNFIRSNITEIGFRAFDAVYCFNPFYENIFQADPIDDSVPLDQALYATYSLYVREQLDQMPAGARLATYFSYAVEVPGSYRMQSAAFDRKLKFWEKVD